MNVRAEGTRKRTRSAARPPAGEASGYLANLMAIAIVLALVAIAVAYGIDAAGRTTREHQAQAALATVPVNVSGVDLTVPTSWLRFPEQPNSAFSDRLDLALNLELADGASLPITISLVPKARARASSALLDTVYLKHFSAEERQGVPGLIGKPLTGNESYASETVWYDPIHQDPFTAKCTTPVGEDDTETCLRTLRLDSGLSAIIGFSEKGLVRWRQFDAPLAALFARIGAGKIER